MWLYVCKLQTELKERVIHIRNMISFDFDGTHHTRMHTLTLSISIIYENNDEL